MISAQTLRRLVYFAAIAEAGSIRGAAQRLNLSVPVLSEALSELEAELGVSLATRTTRSFQLSDTGYLVQRAAQQILDTAQTVTELGAPDRPLKGVLGITAPVEIAGFWLPDKITAFQTRHPDVVFDIDVTDAVVDLRSSKVEIAIRADYVAPDGKSMSSVNVPLVVVAGATAKIDSSGAVDMALFDSQLERQLVGISRRTGRPLPLRFAKTHRVTNRTAALQLARAGAGAVLLMRDTVETELADGRLVELLPDHSFGSVDVVCRFRDRLPGPAAKAFAQSVGLSATRP